MRQLVILHLLLAQALSVMSCHLSALQEQRPEAQQPVASDARGNREWRAATYRGLLIGTSTRADVLHVFGHPKRVDIPADQAKDAPNPEEWYVYNGGGEFTGTMTVVIDKRSEVILRIDLYPENLSREEAIRHFGNDYIMTRYEFCKGFEDEDSAPLYETPDGQFFSIEYRGRGIAIGLDNNGKAGIINYVSKPIGAQDSRCNQTSRPTAPPN